MAAFATGLPPLPPEIRSQQAAAPMQPQPPLLAAFGAGPGMQEQGQGGGDPVSLVGAALEGVATAISQLLKVAQVSFPDMLPMVNHMAKAGKMAEEILKEHAAAASGGGSASPEPMDGSGGAPVPGAGLPAVG